MVWGDNISEMLHDSDIVAMELMGNLMWPIEWHHCQWPWRTCLLCENFI